MSETNPFKKEPTVNFADNPFFYKEVTPCDDPLPAGISLEDAAHQISLERKRKRFNLSPDASEKEVRAASKRQLIEDLYGEEIRRRNGGVLPPLLEISG